MGKLPVYTVLKTACPYGSQCAQKTSSPDLNISLEDQATIVAYKLSDCQLKSYSSKWYNHTACICLLASIIVVANKVIDRLDCSFQPWDLCHRFQENVACYASRWGFLTVQFEPVPSIEDRPKFSCDFDVKAIVQYSRSESQTGWY